MSKRKRNDGEDENGPLSILGNCFDGEMDGEKLAQVKSFAEDGGVAAEVLRELVKLIADDRCKSKHVKVMIRSLLPKEGVAVEDDVVVDLLGAYPRLALDCQKLVLQWLLVIRDRLTEQASQALHSLYGMFFHYLEYDSTLTALCRVLYMLTRRKDVTPERRLSLKRHIQNRRQSGQDVKKLMMLEELFDKYNDNSPDNLKRRRGKTKAKEKFNSKAEIKDFAETLLSTTTGQVNFPKECTKLLQETMFPFMLCLEPREDQVLRLRQVLPHIVEEEFFTFSKKGGHERQCELMNAMVEFSDFMQQTIPELEQFVIRFLGSWNGVQHTAALLKLVSRMQPRPFATMHETILQPLYRVYHCCDANLKAEIILCLKTLLRNWADIDWEAHYNRDQSKGAAFTAIPVGLDHYKVMFDLVKFVDQLLVSGMLSTKDHPSLQFAAGSFYRTVANLNLVQSLPFVVPPSPGVAYRMVLDDSAFGTAIICDVLVQLRESFQKMKMTLQQEQQRGESTASLHTKIELYNSIVWDFCNMLWLNRPLPKPSDLHHENETTRTKTLLFARPSFVNTLRESHPQDHIRDTFSLIHSNAFFGFATKFVEQQPDLQAVEQIQGPAKFEYLKHLKTETRLEGIVSFLETFISSLKLKR